MWLTRMSLHQVSVLLSYRLPFISTWSNPRISSHTGCSSVLCLWEEEQGGSIFYKYSVFLHAGLDWAGWASHAGTSQPGGWGVAVEGRKKEWRRGALPLTLEPELALVLLQNQPFNELPCASEWANFITGCNSTEHKAYQQPLRLCFGLQVSAACKQKSKIILGRGQKLSHHFKHEYCWV